MREAGLEGATDEAEHLLGRLRGRARMAAGGGAVAEAAESMLRRREAGAEVEGGVATVGRVEVEPGASNVIPGRVALSVDVRAPDEGRLERIVSVVPGELSRTRA